MEKRGHDFVRYADDCNIYVSSRVAGNRVMESITKFLEKRLKLKVNAKKSSVDRPWKRKFLGFTVTYRRGIRPKVAAESVNQPDEYKQVNDQGSKNVWERVCYLVQVSSSEL